MDEGVMNQEGLKDTQQSEASPSEDDLSAGGLEATRGIDLGGLLGGLLGRQEPADAGETRAALFGLAEGRAGAADALAGTGLLQEIMRLTGLNKSGALGVILAVLKALGLGKTTMSKPKPKPKPKPQAKPKPKPKPKPSASAASKPKPKPSASSTSAKPKPKPASSSAKPKPKPKPKPKRSGEVDGVA